jgi:hypothetical protein
MMVRQELLVQQVPLVLLACLARQVQLVLLVLLVLLEQQV